MHAVASMQTPAGVPRPNLEGLSPGDLADMGPELAAFGGAPARACDIPKRNWEIGPDDYKIPGQKVRRIAPSSRPCSRPWPQDGGRFWTWWLGAVGSRRSIGYTWQEPQHHLPNMAGAREAPQGPDRARCQRLAHERALPRHRGRPARHGLRHREGARSRAHSRAHSRVHGRVFEGRRVTVRGGAGWAGARGSGAGLGAGGCGVGAGAGAGALGWLGGGASPVSVLRAGSERERCRAECGGAGEGTQRSRRSLGLLGVWAFGCATSGTGHGSGGWWVVGREQERGEERDSRGLGIGRREPSLARAPAFDDSTSCRWTRATPRPRARGSQRSARRGAGRGRQASSRSPQHRPTALRIFCGGSARCPRASPRSGRPPSST